MNGKRVGFISFRIAGTDGVSLETMKWAEIFEEHGWSCYFMAGELETPPECSMLVEELHFQHPEIKKLYNACFDNEIRPRWVSQEMHHWCNVIKQYLYDFIETYNLDLIVPENALTIPLNPPLAMALGEVLAETGLHTIAHHHDFFWERKRFMTNCIWDILNAYYPPNLSNIAHVVINSSGRNQLALRTGISATLIPNVMNFERPPKGVDDYNRDIRQTLQLDDDELFVLQPTRVVQRKGIEHAIELVARMKRKCRLVITHASGDEGYEYERRVREFADLMNVPTLFGCEFIGETRSITSDGSKIYTLQDAYANADLVTYPSLFEGFGNAFLETIYFKKPIVVNNYSIYAYDIKPLGFDVIEMDNFISDDTIAITHDLLDDPERIKRMVEQNYLLGCKYFSYRILSNKLLYLLKSFWGDDAFTITARQ